MSFSVDGILAPGGGVVGLVHDGCEPHVGMNAGDAVEKVGVCVV